MEEQAGYLRVRCRFLCEMLLRQLIAEEVEEIECFKEAVAKICERYRDN